MREEASHPKTAEDARHKVHDFMTKTIGTCCIVAATIMGMATDTLAHTMGAALFFLTTNVAISKLTTIIEPKYLIPLEIGKAAIGYLLIVGFVLGLKIPHAWVFGMFIFFRVALVTENKVIIFSLQGVGIIAVAFALAVSEEFSMNPAIPCTVLGTIALVWTLLIDNFINQHLNLPSKAHPLITPQNRKIDNAFVADLSHELRTPLNVMINFGEMILDEITNVGVLEGKTKAQITRDLKSIQQTSHLLLQIVDKILDFSKLQAGKVKIENKVVDVEQFIKELSGVFQAMSIKNGNSWTANYKITSKDLPLDKNIVGQILINLIDNASKFTHNGLINLTVETTSNGTFILEVEDTGVGIAPEHIALIFDRFNTSNSSISDRGGLGLSIAKQLTVLIGGSISVNSVEKVGSTFNVTIPLQETKLNKKAS